MRTFFLPWQAVLWPVSSNESGVTVPQSTPKKSRAYCSYTGLQCLALLNTVAMLTIRAAYDCDASDDRPPLGKFCLEPISKSPEEDNEAGELDEAEKVVGVVFPADEDATLPLYPSEEAFDQPTSHVTT
jgi:hypothetical protein